MQEKNTADKNSVWFAAIMSAAVCGVVCGAFVPGGRFTAISTADRLPFETAADSLKTLALLVGICFICGFSAVMQPLEAGVPFFFGTGLGLASAEICRSGEYAWGFLALMPGGVLSAAVLSFAARESMRMSSAVFRRTFMPAEYEPADCLLYLKKFALISVMAAGAAAVDGLSVYIYLLISGI